MGLKKSPHLLTTLFGTLLGASTGAFSFATDLHLDLNGIIIRPSHSMVWAIWLMSIVEFTRANKKQTPGMVFFISSAAVAVVAAYVANSGRFSGSAFNSLLPLLSGILFPTFFLAYGRRSDTVSANYTKPSSRVFFLWMLLIAGILSIVRGGNIAMRHLPNEERSLMIFGVEFHHFLTGLCLLSVSLMLLLKSGEKNHFQSFLGYMVVAGLTLTADQLTYIMMYPLSDDAFFSVFSFSGAIICSLLLIFCLVKKVYFR